MPAITVAMPVFNGAKFLGEAIASILEQTYDDFELIISDDGSTDGSREIAQGYAAKDSRIRLIAGRHGGIAAAMNRALAVTRGEYFAPMDQDDISLPDRLGKLALFLGQNPEIALVGGRAKLIDERGNIGKNKVRPLRPRDVASAMLTSTAVIHPASLMRTDAVRAVGEYRPVMPFAEDYDLWLRLMERYNIANIADVVLLKRIHPGAVTQARSKRPAQAATRAIVYLSHLSRVTYGQDWVCAGEPLPASAARFVARYLNDCGKLEPPVLHNLARFARYVPLVTAGSGSVARPYLQYLAKVVRGGDVRGVSRTICYLALHFGYHRSRKSELPMSFSTQSGASEALMISA